MISCASPRLMKAARAARLRSSSSEPVSRTMRVLARRPLQQLARGQIVLRGQNLGGRHQRRLVAVFHGHQHGLQARRSSCPNPHRLAAAGAWGWGRACRPQSRPARVSAPRWDERAAPREWPRAPCRRSRRRSRALPHAPRFSSSPAPERTAPRRSAADAPAWPKPATARSPFPRAENAPRAAQSRDQARRALPASARGRHSGTAPRRPSSRLKITLRCQREARRAAAQRLVDRRNAPHLQQPRLGVVGGVGQHLKLRLDHLQVAVERDGSTLP
jgi:hypothetical protein